MFLKPDEIAELTGLVRPSAQVRWLRHHGYRIDAMQVVAIYRDWSKMEAKRRPQEYPQQQVQVLQVPVWDSNEALNLLRKRAILHHENAKIADAQLKPCTDEERWAKPGQVAVYKAGNKRAARVVDTVQDAVDWMVWRKIAPNNDIYRIDLYLTDHGVKFGEITLAPGAGWEQFYYPSSYKLDYRAADEKMYMLALEQTDDSLAKQH